MATSGEGATSYQGGGAAGGKFRKRPFRRPQTTPYDRPPTAFRSPSTNTWLSKLVDPASKLISASAHKFFSSVFRKRLPPPPQPSPEPNQEPRDRLQEAVPNNCTGAIKPAIDQSGNLSKSSDGSGISEVEQLLKQKTFTRSEIDSLMELLHSRTLELPVKDEDRRAETNISKPLSDLERHEGITTSPVHENRNQRDKCHGIISTPVVNSRVLEEDVASPAELAKAYMGSRPSKVSPSMLGLHSQALREDATLLNNVSPPAKSPIISLASKTAVRAGVPENGFNFMATRSRGRSAIYSMARTPYSRLHPTATEKGIGSTNYGFVGPSSSSQPAWEHGGQFGSKQVALKRRSSVFDDDSGSVGTIRRTRQKPNLLSHGSPGNGVGFDASQYNMSSTQKLLLPDKGKYKVSKVVQENGNNVVPSTNYSSEMGTKILQHLQKMTPKEKSSESKLVAAREKSPTILTPNMLSGQALRSLEDVDSSKFVQYTQDSHKSEALRNDLLPDARDSIPEKQDKAEANGVKKFVVPRDMLTSSMNGDTTSPTKDSVLNVKSADSAISKFAAQLPKKKRAFQMSAHEDSMELDDDIHSNGLAVMLPTEGREELETTVEKTPALPEVKTPAVSVLNKNTDLETYGGSVVGGENSGFTFPTSSAVDKFVPPKDPNASTPSYNLSSKNADKVHPFTFSSSSPANEFSGVKSGSGSDPKQESLRSLGNVASGTTDTQPNILDLDKGDNSNTPKAGDIMGNSETSPSAPSTSTSTSSIFSFSAPNKNPNLNNGSLASNPSIFTSTVPAQASSKFTSQNFNNSSTQASSSTSSTMTPTDTTAATTTITTSAFNSAVSMSAEAPSFPAVSIFNFGSSSTAHSRVSTSGTTTTDSKPIFNFGSSVAPSIAHSTVTTSGAETTDSVAIFNFGSSVAPSTTQSTVLTTSGTEATNSKSLNFGSTVAPPQAVGSTVSTTSGTGATDSKSIFTFGSSVAPSAALSTLSTSGAETTDLDVQTEKEMTFGITNSSPFGGTSFATASTGSSPFGFSSSVTSLTANNQSQGSLFGTGGGSLVSGAQASPGTGIATVTQSMPVQFGSSGSSPVFGTSGITAFTSGSSLFGSSNPVSKLFSSCSSFGLSSSTSSSETNSVSSTSGATTNPFGSSWQPSKSPVFGSSFSSPSLSTGFSFGSSSTFNIAPVVFGNNSTPVSAPSSNSDQMNMEDGMAEDPVQASTPGVSVFGQPPGLSPPAGFMFGSTAPLPSSPFQFVGQQSQATPQNPSPFQASNSVDFSVGGGSFSLGSGGGDRSGRRIVRAARNKNRKK